MPILTTTIGAYPKPSYVNLPDWFSAERTNDYDFQSLNKIDPEELQALEAVLDKATHEVVQDQVEAGIDIPTDGEVRRESYIHYHCRQLNGYNPAKLTERVMRSGSWIAPVPTFDGPISAKAPFLPSDFAVAQAATDRPIKVTIPGPLTISDSTANAYYPDDKAWCADMAAALNAEVLALVDAGCKYIQIDEPVFARYPERALDYGMENLARCFVNVPDSVTKVMHMCCGYPDVLDNEDYAKADRSVYFDLVKGIEDAGIDAISIEDAHRHNDLRLLEKIEKATVILGVVAIARSRVEPVEEIQSRLQQALNHIDKGRLMAAPDCGLGMLPREIAIAKMRNLSAAAHAL